MFRTRRIQLVALVSALLATLAACSPQPGQDPFFDPPEVDRTAPVDAVHGDLIRFRPSVFTTDPVTRRPVEEVAAFQVMFRSTSASGEPNSVTGTVLVPTAEWVGPGERPIVSFGIGTRGLSDACAPSWTITQGWDRAAESFRSMLRRGWAVAVSDMVGLGTPGTHTYGVAREQGTAMLDIVLAAQQIPGAGLHPRAPVGLLGYSEGGASVGWAAQLASTYGARLDIAGAAAGGVPADLRAVATALDGGPFSGLVLLAAVGFDAAYPELDLEGFSNELGTRTFERIKDVCITQFEGLRTLTDVGNRYFAGYLSDPEKVPFDDPRWVRRLEENRLGGTAPGVPVLLQHAYFDQMVPYEQAELLRDRWCAGGANVTWKVHFLAEHALGATLSEAPALNFLSSRFVGAHVDGNC